MKFSAPKLLRMAMTGQHMSYCSKANSSLPATECVCWRFEVKKWDEQSKLAQANRVRKPSARKVHFFGTKCGAKNPTNTTFKIAEVTCKHCLKLNSKQNFLRAAAF